MKQVFVGLIAAVIGFITVGAITGSGGKFDYANAEEEDKQKYLENVIKGFRAGFKTTAGKSAEIVDTRAMAQYDLISVDILMKDKKFKTANAQQIESYRKYMYKNTCKMLGKQNLLDVGITMKIRMNREDGGSFAKFKFDEEVCSRYGV